jgi:hypothetical protein
MSNDLYDYFCLRKVVILYDSLIISHDELLSQAIGSILFDDKLLCYTVSEYSGDK